MCSQGEKAVPCSSSWERRISAFVTDRSCNWTNQWTYIIATSMHSRLSSSSLIFSSSSNPYAIHAPHQWRSQINPNLCPPTLPQTWEFVKPDRLPPADRVPLHSGEVLNGPEEGKLRLQDYDFTRGFCLVDSLQDKQRPLLIMDCSRPKKERWNTRKLEEEIPDADLLSRTWVCPWTSKIEWQVVPKVEEKGAH